MKHGSKRVFFVITVFDLKCLNHEGIWFSLRQVFGSRFVQHFALFFENARKKPFSNNAPQMGASYQYYHLCTYFIHFTLETHETDAYLTRESEILYSGAHSQAS